MVQFVMIHKFCELTGYTDKAVRTKIERGVWGENKVWKRAPDGHIMIDIGGYTSWVQGEKAAKA